MTNNVTLLPIAVKIGPFKNFGDFNITNSLKFGFFSVLKSFASRFFFSYRFLFRVLLIWFVVLQLLAIEKRLAFSATDSKYLSKRLQCDCIMVDSIGRIEIKMGEDRQRKLTANHQQFND